MMKPSKKIALVTGGARRIGEVISRHLAKAGYHLAVHYHTSRREAEELVRELQTQGAEACAFAADLSYPQSIDSLMTEINARFGVLNLLVNNASLFKEDTLKTLQLTQWEEHFSLHLRAPVLLAQAMARTLPKGEKGAIVHILDERVVHPTAEFFSYALSKASLFQSIPPMAQALAPHIRINAVAPGPTLWGSGEDLQTFQNKYRACLLGRGATPEEIAEAVVFLAEASSITGQTLVVDGGYHLSGGGNAPS